jgi:hypothetical protein
MIHFYIGVTIVIILGYFRLKYLDGDFTIISEEIISDGSLVDSDKTVIGHYYTIKRTYQNGRIKIIKKEV